MTFKKEADFEEELIHLLTSVSGWKKDTCGWGNSDGAYESVLRYPDEEDLLKNWANILYNNNKSRDRLNEYPLTSGEMRQIMGQVTNLRTPLKLNGFINGRSVSIVRDNPEDTEHLGKEISLKLFDRMEIAGGQSVYQIAQQPKFPAKNQILNDRRGDVMLLINGMPVIHIELKRSGVPVSEACHQIEKYSHEGVFTGLFSLVQIFVAMTPEETLYFANPGPDGRFNPSFYFHWADFDNEPINNWNEIVRTFLSIPMAHQMIGFYTIADNSDGILKVMRSYQVNAANRISDTVRKTKWGEQNQLGGYVWHTTGSGKTMTSFKSAQLIADSGDADKVVFLMDRIELGTQSLQEYRGFANDDEDVQATENTGVLIGKLKSTNPADTLIVTSIQKMSNVPDDAGLKARDLETIRRKRIVFIVDEAHRSTFGDMLICIKETFPQAIFFGFTGTPIQKENQKKKSTTATVFGNELHRYSIADGIRDGNVLGFDPYMVRTYRDKEVRKAVALEMAHASSEKEALDNKDKRKVYMEYMDSGKVPMAGYVDSGSGKNVRGIEDFIPNAQYRQDAHTHAVVEDIRENFRWLSTGKGDEGVRFHGIFATSSIPDAINYYRLFKELAPELKVTALFDPNIDNKEGAICKEDGLVEIIQDYNRRYGQDFTIPTFARMKKDIAARLAHKKPYERIVREPEKQLDLLIVVDQMLTGFDSKWVNTLYLDKVLLYENIIQAFSRTNRLFEIHEKPFGIIRYYRKPYTMKRNIDSAIKLYSGDRAYGLFVPSLLEHLEELNHSFRVIERLFRDEEIDNFERLPEDGTVCGKFAKEFRELVSYLEAAQIQGFTWEKNRYEEEETGEAVEVELDERTYLILLIRYKEIPRFGGGEFGPEIPYDLDPYIEEMDTGKIDAEYMNSRFEKYYKLLKRDDASEGELEKAEEELHRTFSTLTMEEQKYANLFLHDIQSGDVEPVAGATLRDYITEYMADHRNDRIHRFAETFGMDEEKLRSLMALHPTEGNINEFGRFDALRATVDKEKARAYFEEKEQRKIAPPKVTIKIDNILRAFILEDEKPQ